MNNLKNSVRLIIIGIPLIIVCCFIIFNLMFAFGMIQSNNKKSISSSIISEYKTGLINNSNKLVIDNVHMYYQQSKLFTDITLKNDLTFEDSKIIAKNLKDFILKPDVHKYLTKFDSTLEIRLSIHGSNSSYYYQSPYYLPEGNPPVENHYKLWYLVKATGETVQSLNID